MATPDGKKVGGTEIEIPKDKQDGVISRVAQGLRYAFTGKPPNGFFPPGEPMQPMAQEEAHGRRFDYAFATNLTPKPRGEQGEGAVTFDTLRRLSDPTLGGLDVLRLAIETRKDQMESQEWKIRARDNTGDGGRRARLLERALRKPDGVHTYRVWMRQLLEDLLVIDAPAIYLRKTKGKLPSADATPGAQPLLPPKPGTPAGEQTIDAVKPVQGPAGPLGAKTPGAGASPPAPGDAQSPAGASPKPPDGSQPPPAAPKPQPGQQEASAAPPDGQKKPWEKLAKGAEHTVDLTKFGFPPPKRKPEEGAADVAGPDAGRDPVDGNDARPGVAGPDGGAGPGGEGLPAQEGPPGSEAGNDGPGEGSGGDPQPVGGSLDAKPGEGEPQLGEDGQPVLGPDGQPMPVEPPLPARFSASDAGCLLEPVDGATLKVLVNSDGRTPLAPDPAFAQQLKGLPATQYTLDEIIYAPRNLRTNRIYGFSPVEQVLTTINIALRRQLSQLEYYTAGNVPDMILGVPETWNPDQIAQFQVWWDSILSGNSAERRKARFVPGGTTPFPLQDPKVKDEWDDWLARIVCYAFSLPYAALVKEVNRATAETSKEAGQQEGLEPLKLWWKDVMDDLLDRGFDAADLEFVYADEEIGDAKTKSDVWCALVAAKIAKPSEARASYGMAPDPSLDAAAAAPPPSPFGGGFGGPPPVDENGDPVEPKPGEEPGGKPPPFGAKKPNPFAKPGADRKPGDAGATRPDSGAPPFPPKRPEGAPPFARKALVDAVDDVIAKRGLLAADEIGARVADILTLSLPPAQPAIGSISFTRDASGAITGATFK